MNLQMSARNLIQYIILCTTYFKAGPTSHQALAQFRGMTPTGLPPLSCHITMVTSSGRLSTSSTFCLRDHVAIFQSCTSTSTTFRDFVSSQPSSLTWALEFCTNWENAEAIVAELTQGTVIAVSNGSTKDGFGLLRRHWRVPRIQLFVSRVAISPQV